MLRRFINKSGVLNTRKIGASKDKNPSGIKSCIRYSIRLFSKKVEKSFWGEDMMFKIISVGEFPKFEK